LVFDGPPALRPEAAAAGSFQIVGEDGAAAGTPGHLAGTSYRVDASGYLYALAGTTVVRSAPPQ
jgi:hypothetical protein